MADVRPTASGSNDPGGKGTATGFELRLERGGAFVQLADQPIAPGLRLEALSLEVPDLTFPFPVGQGSGQFRTRLCDLARFSVVAEPEAITAALAKVDAGALGIAALEPTLRDGFAELAGRVVGGPAFTLVAGLVPHDETGVAIVFHSPRVYGPAPVAAAALPHLAARALATLGLSTEPLSSLLRRTLAPRGWKIPRAGLVRLVRAELAASGARLVWSRDEAAAEPTGDPDLLTALEGARSFRDAEARLAAGDLAGARDRYLAAGPAAAGHPFAAERLLSLLLLEDRFHDEALDLASDWLARRPDFAPALLAEASVRIARGEDGRASQALATLAAAAAARGARSSALAAAEACFALPGADRGHLLAAVETALGLRRDHLGALRALRAIATARGEREGLLRANRRLVAYSPDEVEKARAHAELGELLLEADPPAARLHLDQALRLSPDDPDALGALARACEAAGEPLRAVRARDRLRALHEARGDRASAGRAALDAGLLWEERLSHDENALLRYRDACDLLPSSADAHARAARVAERLGRWADAADHHAAVLAALDPAAPGARELAARTHLALAEMAERRLDDSGSAAAHLEAVLGHGPADGDVLRRLAALYRRLDRPAELLGAIDRLAPLAPAAERAPLLAEAGALAGDRLSLPDAARSRFAAALALDERCRPALEGLARLAAERGDASAERDAVAKLVPIARDRDEEAALWDRHALASERAGDLAGAIRAVAAARRAAPALPRLFEALRLARRNGDPAAVAGLLAEQAAAARAAGDVALAAAAWLERGRLLAPAQPALALAAIAEARALAPGDPEALRAQAELAEATGDARLALGCLRALLAAAQASDAPALEVRAARAALRAGEPVAAREHAERACGGDAPGAAEVLADVLERTGDDEGRAALLERLGRPLEAARLLEGMGQPDRARAALERAAEVPATAAVALDRLAALRFAAGDPAGGAVALVRLAELHRAAGATDLLTAVVARAETAARELAPGVRLDLAVRLARAAGPDDPAAAERLLEAGLAALEQDLAGAEAALREALARGVDRDLQRAALGALVTEAARRSDAAAERGDLLALVPLLPTGARPARLRRLAALALAAGDVPAARAAAEEARTLAPRDAAAVELARDVARAAGDEAAVAERLHELAALRPADAGALGLERARLLARLGDAAGADDGYAAALAALPPELGLAREHARHRRATLPQRGVADPVERCAKRLPDPAAAATALREAAAIAFGAGETAVALRCARRAYARTRDDLAFAGPILARLLYVMGSRGEALVLHRKLLEDGFRGLPPDEGIVLARQLAELAEDAGECALALAALDALLAKKPQDADAALRRFRLDPDRARAARRLAAIAERPGSARRRAGLLAVAAEATLRDVGDVPLAERLWLEARADAARPPALLAAIERTRAAALREIAGPASTAALAALHDAAGAAQSAGDGAGALAILEEAIATEHAHGLLAEAAQDLLQLDALAAAEGDFARSAARAREAGALLREAGDLAGAAEALRRSAASDPANDDTWRLLEEVAAALGDGSPLLAEVLEQEVARAKAGPVRAAARARLASALARGGDRPGAIAVLEAALAESPDDVGAALALEGLLAEDGRGLERARLRLARAARVAAADERLALLREAAAILTASGAAEDRACAADAWTRVAREAPADLDAGRAAAALLLALGRREDAVPHLAAVVRAEPDDEEAARQLADAFSERHRERAELFLGRAAHATGAARALRLREAAKALFAAGEDARAKALLREAFDASPADDAAFFAAIRDAAADPDRLDAALLARARAVPAEAAGCHRARADALLAFGAVDRALDAYRACVDAAPHDGVAIAALAEALAASQGDAAATAVDLRLAALADARPGAVPGVVEAASRYRLGLVAWSEGRPADGIAHLERALRIAPDEARAGVALTALAHGHAVAGDGAAALAAARARVERARTLGLEEERRNALRAGAELAAAFEDGSPDAAALRKAFAEADAEPPAAALAAGAPEDEDVERLAREVAAGPGAPGFAAALDRLRRRAADRGEHRSVAAFEALRADATAEDEPRALAWLASAEALLRADADADEIRTALDLAADADPDLAAPWSARAALETRLGKRLAAARAFLSASIRAEGASAADAALEAARLFEEEGRHADAARAYRAAVAARPGCVPARRLLAEEALAAGDAAAAAEHLAAIPTGELPVEARPEHQRALARALEAAGRTEEAERVWSAEFALEPGDVEAFARLGAIALASERSVHLDPGDGRRSGLDAWLALAAQHDVALASAGDVAARRELRCARGRIFAERGRLEAARGALLAALELDPAHGASQDALAELDGRADEWAAVAAELAAEAADATDRAEAASLLLRAARILRDRLGHEEEAAAALQEARVRARLSDSPAAQRVAHEADVLLEELAEARANRAEGPSTTSIAESAPPESPLVPGSAPISASASGFPPPLEPPIAAEEPPLPAFHLPEPSPLDLAFEDLASDALRLDLEDPVVSILRSEADASEGPGRADALERLAAHLEHAGDLEGADAARAAAATADPVPAARAAVASASDAPAAEQVRLRRALADLLEARGDLEGAIGALLTAQGAAPDDVAIVEALARLTDAAGRPADGLAYWERAADLGPEAGRARKLNALATRAEELGEADRAQWLWERARTADPRDLTALVALVRRYAEAGELAQLRVVADILAGVAGAGVLEPFAAALGRAHLEAGDLDAARTWLETAYRADPADLTLARDLGRLAEKLGDFDAYVRLGAICADAIGSYDPLAAAARFRHFAEVAEEKLADRDRAVAFLERAVALVPDDADTHDALRALLGGEEGAAGAEARALDAARENPADPASLGLLAARWAGLAAEAPAPDAARLRERARLAASLAAFALREPAPAAPALPVALPDELRDRASAPGATGALASLFRLLAPWLEPLFPADLGHRGASSRDRLTPAAAPALHAALDAASRALHARPHAAFVVPRAGLEASIENTQPPALVFSSAVAALPPAGLAFVSARALVLLDRGWALAGKFAPRDIGILLELSCRFAGAAPPDLGLPPQRADAFLEALSRTVPPSARDRAVALGAEAADELAAQDPRAIVTALRRSANRIGLLYAGDPHAALAALAALASPPHSPLSAASRGAGSVGDPLQALAVPDLRDLALFALSDPFVELRASALERS
jgi:tetratricopeptide (TPR) repeat protein